jgi:hypothetical protein
MTTQGKVPIWVTSGDLILTFYPTPQEFGEIRKVMNEQNKTRDEAALIVMDESYKPKSSESRI